MHQNPNSTSRRLAGAAIVALLATAGLAACGSDDDSSSAATTAASTESSEEGEEYTLVEPAVVTAGLTKLPATIASAIAAIGTPSAEAKLEAIEDEWYSFEGTVRETDAGLYLEIEDQLTPLQRQIEDGDTATATATAAKLSELFAQYLAKYPG